MLDGLVLLRFGLKLGTVDWTLAGLWATVVVSGLYHGVNPAMGWPLAVSAGLMERMLPFALLLTLVEWRRQIQIGQRHRASSSASSIC